MGEKNLPKIIIATHGNLCESFLSTAEMIVGKLDEVFAVGLKPEESPEDYLLKLKEKVETSNNAIILVDILGGTPFNTAMRLAKEYHFQVFTGVNLGMLIEAEAQRRNLTNGEMSACILQAGKESCKIF